MASFLVRRQKSLLEKVATKSCVKAVWRHLFSFAFSSFFGPSGLVKTRVAVATAHLFQAKMGQVEIFGFPCGQLLGAPFEPKMSFLGHSVPKLWPIVCFEGHNWPFYPNFGFS